MHLVELVDSKRKNEKNDVLNIFIEYVMNLMLIDRSYFDYVVLLFL